MAGLPSESKLERVVKALAACRAAEVEVMVARESARVAVAAAQDVENERLADLAKVMGVNVDKPGEYSALTVTGEAERMVVDAALEHVEKTMTESRREEAPDAQTG